MVVSGHFRDGFESIAGSIHNIEHPGTLFTFEWANLGFERLRPLYPLDMQAQLLDEGARPRL